MYYLILPITNQGYLFWPFLSENFLSKLKNREEFEGGLEKGKGNGGKRSKKEKSDKTHVKIPLKYRKKNPQKQGRILQGGGIFWLNIYPCSTLNVNDSKSQTK